MLGTELLSCLPGECSGGSIPSRESKLSGPFPVESGPRDFSRVKVASARKGLDLEWLRLG